jgi:hypothetical protein
MQMLVNKARQNIKYTEPELRTKLLQTFMSVPSAKTIFAIGDLRQDIKELENRSQRSRGF